MFGLIEAGLKEEGVCYLERVLAGGSVHGNHDRARVVLVAVNTRIELGLQAGRDGAPEEAEAQLRQAVALAPPGHRSLRHALLNLGGVLHKRGDLAGAAEQFSELVRMDPGDVSAHVNLGIVRYAQGDYAAASDHFGRATDLALRDWQAYLGLAQSLEKEGRRDEAAAAFRRVLSLQPGNAEAAAGLGRLGVSER